MTWFGWLILALLALKWATQLCLQWLNDRNVRAHSDAVPELLKDVIDPATYARTVEYTLAKSKLRKTELTYEALLLGLTLFSGILPLIFDTLGTHLGQLSWAMGAFLFFVGIALSVLDLPFDWFAQFRLEERFGFNTTTQKLWWADRLKGALPWCCAQQQRDEKACSSGGSHGEYTISTDSQSFIDAQV